MSKLGFTLSHEHVLLHPEREIIVRQKANWPGDDYAEFGTGVGVLTIFLSSTQEEHIPGSAEAFKNRSVNLEFRVADEGRSEWICKRAANALVVGTPGLQTLPRPEFDLILTVRDRRQPRDTLDVDNVRSMDTQEVGGIEHAFNGVHGHV